MEPFPRPDTRYFPEKGISESIKAITLEGDSSVFYMPSDVELHVSDYGLEKVYFSSRDSIPQFKIQIRKALGILEDAEESERKNSDRGPYRVINSD